jgi:hypothetical protein
VSDFLGRLAARARGIGEVIRPRPTALFETVAPTLAAGVPSGARASGAYVHEETEWVLAETEASAEPEWSADVRAAEPAAPGQVVATVPDRTGTTPTTVSVQLNGRSRGPGRSPSTRHARHPAPPKEDEGLTAGPPLAPIAPALDREGGPAATIRPAVGQETPEQNPGLTPTLATSPTSATRQTDPRLASQEMPQPSADIPPPPLFFATPARSPMPPRGSASPSMTERAGDGREPDIRVTIGRVEVRAALPETYRRPPASKPEVTDLDEYLRRHRERGGR